MRPERPKPRVEQPVKVDRTARKTELAAERRINSTEIERLQDRYQQLAQEIKVVGEALTERWGTDARISRELGAINHEEAVEAFRKNRP